MENKIEIARVDYGAQLLIYDEKGELRVIMGNLDPVSSGIILYLKSEEANGKDVDRS